MRPWSRKFGAPSAFPNRIPVTTCCLKTLRIRADETKAAPGKLSTTVMFFQAMLLLFFVFRLTSVVSGEVIPNGAVEDVVTRASRQKWPWSAPNDEKSAGFGGYHGICSTAASPGCSTGITSGALSYTGGDTTDMSLPVFET